MEHDSLLESQLTATEAPLDRIPKLHLEREESVTDKPSVYFPQDEPIEVTIAPVFEQWNLASPDIIITLVSGTRSYTAWKHGDHRAALQKGIIKLIKATEAWVIDIGLDYGLSKTIGDAIRNEQCFRKSVDRKEVLARGYFKRRRHGITLIGIAPLAIINGHETEGDKSHQDDYVHPRVSFDLNPSHTHYIFVGGPYNKTKILRVEIEQELARQASIRRSPMVFKEKVIPEGVVKTTATQEQVPLLAILVQGDHLELDQVLEYLKNGIPVLIIRGTGFLADVLAYAYEEHVERGTTDQLKADISKRLARSFCEACVKSDTDRMIIRDKILECIRLSTQDDRKLLSTTDSSEDLVDLQDSILSAVFAARAKTLSSSKEQIRADFLLTLRLNKPAVAAKVIARDEARVFQVDNLLFEKALLWKDREQFVERFLEEDFCIHKFMNHSTLLRLFRRAEDNEFFVSVVWDQIPRHHYDFQVDETFVTRDLNMIILKLSGLTNFVSMYELSSNYLGIYVEDEYAAERKAMNALLIWALLMNRFNLVKVLWKYCENPIPVALFISAMYKGLAKHCSSASVVTTLGNNGRAFSTMAIDVLDMSYRESSARTFDLLNQKFPDFNAKTAIKLAYFSENRYFLAHEACQIWLDWLWEGGLEISESWESRISEEVKLILSALLLFPIPFWIGFPRKNFARHPRDEPGQVNTDNFGTSEFSIRPEANDKFHIPSTLDYGYTEKTLKKLKDLREYEAMRKDRRFTRTSFMSSSPGAHRYMQELPFWRKVYYLWTTPRTKFWIFQVFYWIYLSIFSIATILPPCNPYNLDWVVVIWTALILAEIILRTLDQRRLDFPVNLTRRIMEMALLGFFVGAMAIYRMTFGVIRPFHIRALMACGLLYMYYRMVSVFFPMNSVLGPMLYRIKKMITVDFFLFVRLAAPFILANMFALQAVMYPDLPFGEETFRKGFYRAFFTLFIGFVGELDRKSSCEKDRIHNNTDQCWVGNYASHECPTLGVTTYMMNIQFLVIMRLILVVLLNALFAATMIKVKEDADFIFKYQRYDTVLDFAARPALPPPLTIFNYFFNWLVLLISQFKKMEKSKKETLTTSRMVKLIQRKAPDNRSTGSYSYWMTMTKEYYRKKAKEDREKKALQDQTTRIKAVSEDQKILRNMIDRLTEKLKEMEKTFTTHFEAIKHGIERKELPKENQTAQNVLSRISPYPKTDIKRFLVADNDVSWASPMEIYEPPNYSKPVEEFPESERSFVDPVVDSKIDLTALGDPVVLCWNSTCVWEGVNVDRRSVLRDDEGGTLPYVVAEDGLPRNPIGRTGISGRGLLYRFGPNHRVKIVLSRIKEGNLVLLVARGFPNEVSSLLPTKPPMGSGNIYACACDLFASLFIPVVPLEEVAVKLPENEDMMRQDMERIALLGSSSARGKQKSLDVEQIFIDYIDNPRNTDQAWLEGIVWHIHMIDPKQFSRRRNENFIWKEPKGLKTAGPFEDHLIEMVTMRKDVDA